MDILTMRRLVTSAYPSPRWADKVKKMLDDQIIALYYSLLQRGKIK